MSLSSCHIHFTSRPGRTVYASGALIKRLQLTSGQSVRLEFGKLSVQTTVRRAQRAGLHLYVPTLVRSELKLPVVNQLTALSRSGTVRLGPLVGVMTTAQAPNSASPFGSRTSFIRQLVTAGMRKGYCFAFSPGSIQWRSRTVTGWVYTRGKGWSRRTLPMPDAVYNRLPSRSAEKSSAMESLKEQLVRSDIPLFNWSFFEKWDVYRLLEDDAEASKHVPESHMSPTRQQIRQMLDRHRFVYLKPTGGSLGKGIYRITYRKGYGYYARFRLNGKNILRRYGNFADLMKMLGRRNGRLSHYVVQQGIRLVEIDQCPLDFRFHLNKNGNNRWVVAGIGAKKAGRGSVTTHLRNGGELMTPMQALEKLYSPAQAARMLEQAKEVTIKLAEAIERKYPHTIGELGFDIGLDQDGKFWMFEANSKPGRSIYKHAALKDEGRATVNYIFEYCSYLSRFRNGGRDA